MFRSKLNSLHDLLWIRQSLKTQKRSLRAARVATTISGSKKSAESRYDNDEIIIEQNSDHNYLGINESKDFSSVIGSRSNHDRMKQRQFIEEKYQPLLHPARKRTTGNRKKIGLLNVRLDSENQPRFHGEFEKSDELVFKTLDDVVQHIEGFRIQSNQKSDEKVSESIHFIVDENIKKKPKNTNPKSLANEKINFRYANQLVEKPEKIMKQSEKINEGWINYEQSKRESSSDEKNELSLSEKIAQVEFVPQGSNVQDKPEIISGYEYLKLIRLGQIKAHFQEDFDHLKNLIPQEKLDSKGYRILKNQVPDFSKLTNSEIIKMLEKQILFNNSDLVALNKPYGIAVHAAFGSMNQDDYTISTSRVNSKFHHVIHLSYFLPELANCLGCSKLYPVHRLDRDTTGVLLLAKTQEKARQLNHLFREQKIQKTYVCITKNKPDQPEGIIDIPIELGYIKSPDGRRRERMVLCPEPLEGIRLQRQWRNAKKAITHYKVKSDRGNAALLEVMPQTGVRHQIRVHLGFGLRCPILGDHKYSNLDSLSPQKLPSDILMALKIRQAKSRTIPMHLHAYLLAIPQAGEDGRNIFVRAPLPDHFRRNMRSLKLRWE